MKFRPKKENFVDTCEHEWKLKDQYTTFSICCECCKCGTEWFFNSSGDENLN